MEFNENPSKKVVVVTVTYGDRYRFLSKVIDSVICEQSLVKLILVDNSSVNRKEIDECVEENTGKIILIRNEKNEGSAGGFAKGIDCARGIDCDYVLLLDDDNVAEGAIPKFLEAINSHDDKTILSGNRSGVISYVQDVYTHPEKYIKRSRTLFNIFSFEKFKYFSEIFLAKKDVVVHRVVEVKSFAYGGAFLPKSAILDASLPDKSLWTYCDDIAYSWGVVDKGYRCFAYFDIHIKDIDLTFSGSDKTSHIVDLLTPQVSDFKVYYRMRNAVKISRDHSDQWTLTLLVSIFIWYVGLVAVFLFKKRFFGVFQIKRACLVAKAFYCGFIGDMRPF